MDIDTLKAFNGEVKKILNTFLADPPDTPYQRGYLAGVFEIKKMLDKHIKT